MFLHPLRSSAGFTYIAALTLVIVMGIMLGVGAQSWKMIMDREKEAELLMRGSEIRAAMKRWYQPHGNSRMPQGVIPPAATPLRELDDLCKDPRLAQNVKYLRCQWKDNKLRVRPDPITGEEWSVIKDANMGIVGVASPSGKEPIKQANFPQEYLDFEGKKKYSDWQFIWNKVPPKKAATTTITGVQTTQPSGKTSP